MDGKFLALSIVIFALFAILESSADNFYPLRYGKRDSQGTMREGRLLRGPKYSRRSDISNDLFYGSRYGKRDYNTTPPGTFPVSESGSPDVRDRIGRSLDGDASRSNKFYIGSRFGKRGHRPGENSEGKNELGDDHVVCRYTGFRRLYQCLGRSEESRDFDKIF